MLPTKTCASYFAVHGLKKDFSERLTQRFSIFGVNFRSAKVSFVAHHPMHLILWRVGYFSHASSAGEHCMFIDYDIYHYFFYSRHSVDRGFWNGHSQHNRFVTYCNRCDRGHSFHDIVKQRRALKFVFFFPHLFVLCNKNLFIILI